MLLKQKSLVLIFVVHVINGAAGYVVEDGKSPPKTLKSWLPEKNFRRLKGRSQSGFNAQRAQRRNSNTPVRQQASPIYFDSHSPKRAQAAHRNAPLFRQTQGRQHARNLPHQARETYPDSSLFQQVDGRNFGYPFPNRQQSRTPFEQHEVIDARSPISKRAREQNLFWSNNNENHGTNIKREQNSVRPGGGGIRDNLDQGYQHQFFRGKDITSTLINRRQSNEVQRGRDHFFMQQNRAHGNHHEEDDTETDFSVGENDYSHEITYGGNEEEIRYKSPFSDEGASNDHIDEYYDFFSNQEAFKDNAQYYSLEVDVDQKTNIVYPPDFEADFSDDTNFSIEETHVKDTLELSGQHKPARHSLDSFEVGFDNSFTKIRNPVRSLEAIESQEYDNRKIKTIYTVSRGEDKDGIYPVLTSVRTNIEDTATPKREGKNLQVSPQSTRNRKSFEIAVSEERELRSNKQNRRGREVGPPERLFDSRYSKQVEKNQDEDKRTARHIQHNHVPGYTKHRPNHVHLTNGVGAPIVITNPPEIHQTVEVHHQPVPHHPHQSIVSIQSPPGAFVEVPQYVPGVQELAHFIDPHQHPQQPYLEVNIPKNVKVRKIRKGYLYELHLTEEEHLHPKENAYDHYPPGHLSKII